MEIKVFCRDVDGMELAPPVKVCGKLKDAFSLKEYLDYDAEPFGFKVSVILQTARRAIEVRKDHPRYRVMVDGNSRDVLTDDFNLAALRVMKFWENDRHAVLERWRVYGNGVKRWEPVG